MGINVKWDDPDHSIVHMEIKGAWTLEEYLFSADEVLQMVTSSPHDCYLIVDMTRSNAMPMNIMPHIRSAGRRIPIKGIALTGLPKIAVMLASFFRSGQREGAPTTIWATTLDDARQQVKSHIEARN